MSEIKQITKGIVTTLNLVNIKKFTQQSVHNLYLRNKKKKVDKIVIVLVLSEHFLTSTLLNFFSVCLTVL